MLLQVSRREAIRLMHRFGGYQAGRTFLIGRDDLSGQLAAIQRGDGYQWESRRRERLEDALKAKRRVVIQVTDESRGRKLVYLPSGVKLERNRFEIRFESAETYLVSFLSFPG